MCATIVKIRRMSMQGLKQARWETRAMKAETKRGRMIWSVTVERLRKPVRQTPEQSGWSKKAQCAVRSSAKRGLLGTKQAH